MPAGDFVGGAPYAWLILEGYSAEIYAGKGIQDDDNYVHIEEDGLYHVVTGHYLTYR